MTIISLVEGWCTNKNTFLKQPPLFKKTFHYLFVLFEFNSLYDYFIWWLMNYDVELIMKNGNEYIL